MRFRILEPSVSEDVVKEKPSQKKMFKRTYKNPTVSNHTATKLLMYLNN